MSNIRVAFYTISTDIVLVRSLYVAQIMLCKRKFNHIMTDFAD